MSGKPTLVLKGGKEKNNFILVYMEEPPMPMHEASLKEKIGGKDSSA